MLLEHDEDYIIVKSSQSGLMQHDAMSWQVLGAFLVKAKKLSAQSRRLNKALSSWINSVDNERREEFVETLFGLLYASGAKNLSDVSADRLAQGRLYVSMPDLIRTAEHLLKICFCRLLIR